jgi:hypothetical protein
MQGCTRMQPVTIRRQQRQQRRSTAAAAVALTVYQQVHLRAGAAGWHSQTLQERAEHEVAWCGAAACEEASGTGNVACKQDVGELSLLMLLVGDAPQAGTSVYACSVVHSVGDEAPHVAYCH